VVAGCFRRIATLAIAHCRGQPFRDPAPGVVRRHAAGHLEALAYGAATFLGLAEAAPELADEPRLIRPVVPAIGLVVGAPVLRDLVDQFPFHFDSYGPVAQ